MFLYLINVSSILGPVCPWKPNEKKPNESTEPTEQTEQLIDDKKEN
jgi:hypothetical protein